MMITPRQRKNFYTKIAPADERGCTLWAAAKDADGYGQFGLTNPRRMERAHRVAYILAKGPIPDGMLILHSCDTPACVNPDHLRTGTQQDNSDDMVERGREAHLKGEINGRARLTASDIHEIDRLRFQGWTQQAIADKFGVGKQNISRILRRERWAHVRVRNYAPDIQLPLFADLDAAA